MGIEYELVNATKSERVSLASLRSRGKREIAGDPAAAAVVAWYMLDHPRDRISFVTSDIDDRHPAWPLPGVTRAEVDHYADMTTEVVTALVAAGILEERGRSVVNDSVRGSVVVRDLRNVWQARVAP